MCMKDALKIALGAGAGFFVLYKMLNWYTDHKLRKAGIYDLTGSVRLTDKVSLLKRSPYNPKKYRI